MLDFLLTPLETETGVLLGLFLVTILGVTFTVALLADLLTDLGLLVALPTDLGVADLGEDLGVLTLGVALGVATLGVDLGLGALGDFLADLGVALVTLMDGTLLLGVDLGVDLGLLPLGVVLGLLFSLSVFILLLGELFSPLLRFGVRFRLTVFEVTDESEAKKSSNFCKPYRPGRSQINSGTPFLIYL